MSQFDKSSNLLLLYLISALVNFSCEFGKIITRYEPIPARPIFTLNQLMWTGSKYWTYMTSRFIIKTLFNIINTTKCGFRIVKSSTILKNNSKNVIYWRKIHLVDIQSENPERYIMMQPISILRFLLTKWEVCLCKLLIRWHIQSTHYLIIINDTIFYIENTNYFNKNSQSHIKVKVPLPTFVYPNNPISHILSPQ